MKSLILVKMSPTIQLAHLYEHIFCTHLKKFFYDRQLFKYVDYSLVGTTFEEGVIEIDLRLYSDLAIKSLSDISSLDVSFDESVISIAATQILAEEEKPIASTGMTDVIADLKKLHEIKWIHADDLEIDDRSAIRRRTGSFYLASGDPLPARNLAINACLDVDFANSHHYLLPLFHQISKIITLTLQDMLAMKNGYYGDDFIYKIDRKSAILKTIMKVANANNIYIDITRDLSQCIGAFDHLRQSGALERFASQLQNHSYANETYSMPNTSTILYDTQIYVGAKGWQKIATTENINLLLRHMSLEIKFGRKKVSAPLVKA